MKKRFFVIPLVLLALVLATFFFSASKSNWPSSQYHQVLAYGASTVPSTPDTLVTITWNLGYLSGMTNNLPVGRDPKLFERNLELATALLQKHQPHLLCLQEVDFASERSFYQDQLALLAQSLPMNWAYRSVNWDKNYVPFPYWPPSQHFGQMLSGQAILSVFPIEIDTTVTLIHPIGSPFYYRAFYLNRLVQIADVKVGTTTVKVMNVHLEAFDEATRVEQAKVVRQLYEHYAGEMPVIMAGDFNSLNESADTLNGAVTWIAQAPYIQSAITPQRYASNPVAFHTFSSGRPDRMIDYIFYNANFIQPVAATTLREAGEISDHLPVMMKWVLVRKDKKI